MIHSNTTLNIIPLSRAALRSLGLATVLALPFLAPATVQAKYLKTDWTISTDEYESPAFDYSISNSATVTISGAGARWSLADLDGTWGNPWDYSHLTVGGAITGSGDTPNYIGNIWITNSGKLETGASDIGGFGNGIGTVYLSGAGSSWTVHGPTGIGGGSEPGGPSAETDWSSIYVGSWAGGTGTLTVSAGAVVTPGQPYTYGAIGNGRLPGPGVYVGYHPQALLAAPYFRADAGNGTLAGSGGNINGNVFIGNTGTLTPGATPGTANATNPNFSAAIGTINITGGANLSFIGGRLDLDISSVTTGDKIILTDAGLTVAGGNRTVSFTENAGKVTIFLRLSDAVLNAGHFDVEVISGASSILGFMGSSKIQIVSATTGWDFWTTIEGTAPEQGYIHGLRRESPPGGSGVDVVPEPGTYATFGAGLLAVLAVVHRCRKSKNGKAAKKQVC